MIFFNQIKDNLIFSFKQLIRNRIAIILLFLLPAAFFMVTILTLKEVKVIFQLAALSKTKFIRVSMIDEGLTFVALTSIGALSSFIGFIFINKEIAPSKRLILCGYKLHYIIIAKLLFILLISIILSIYIIIILLFFFNPHDAINFFSGFFLLGYIYGAFGMLIGTIVKRELEGILIIILLINVDVGWLQNPIFYAEALNKFIIRYLPGFYPSQTAMISAFTKESVILPLIYSLIYGTIILLAAIIIFKIKLKNHSKK